MSQDADKPTQGVGASRYTRLRRSLVVPFARFAKFSAQHPLHISIGILLISAIAYLSFINYYLNDWEAFLRGQLTTTYLNKDQLLQECTHYYLSRFNSDWSNIPYSNANDLIKSNCSHYYLYIYSFFGSNSSSSLPDISNTIYQAEDTRYVLSAELLNPTATLTSADGQEWLYDSTIDYVLELKHNFFDFVRSFLRIDGLEQTDLIIVATIYAMALTSIVSLFKDMKLVGSRGWLSFCVITSLICSFFLAISTALFIVGKRISIFQFAVTMPCFMIIVGFEYKINISAYILRRIGILNISRRFTADMIIYHAYMEEGQFLLQRYLLFLVGAICGMVAFHNYQPLFNASMLFALILLYDFLLFITFYAAVLSLKFQMSMIQRSTVLRKALEEEYSPRLVARHPTPPAVLGTKNWLKYNWILTSIGKYSAIPLFLVVNLYNVNLRWVYTTSKTIFNNFFLTPLPTGIHPMIKDDNIKMGDFGTVISVLPVLRYSPRHQDRNSENLMLLLYRYIDSSIRDKLISKVILAICVLSVVTNAYLMRVAKVHTDYTVTQAYTKSQMRKEQDPYTRERLRRPFQLRRPVSPMFSLDGSDEEYSTDMNEGSPRVYTRNLQLCEKLMKSGRLSTLRNNEIVNLIINNKLSLSSLEKNLPNPLRAVEVRRETIAKLAECPSLSSNRVPFRQFDYGRAIGTCCENMVGYMPIPLGISGPLMVDGISYFIPMATTEGGLVSSLRDGCKAINASGGTFSLITKDGTTEGSCVRFPTLDRAGACKNWLDSDEGQKLMQNSFNSTSRFARLLHIQTALAGDLLFIKFRSTAGDATGANMINKGIAYALGQMIENFGWYDMEILSTSSNYSPDKKSAALNWIEGRGKSVVVEVTMPSEVIKKIFGVDLKEIIDVNTNRNLVGSAVSGSIGGFNSHAANIVTAMFLALGQDAARNIGSSNCITTMSEYMGHLKASVSMPSIEVATIGEGTMLETQSTMLSLLRVKGPHPTKPGENSRQLARIIASAVLAGEISFCAAAARSQRRFKVASGSEDKINTPDRRNGSQ